LPESRKNVETVYHQYLWGSDDKSVVIFSNAKTKAKAPVLTVFSVGGHGNIILQQRIELSVYINGTVGTVTAKQTSSDSHKDDARNFNVKVSKLAFNSDKHVKLEFVGLEPLVIKLGED
jgi:Ca2+-binding RTX toxin-like protein